MSVSLSSLRLCTCEGVYTHSWLWYQLSSLQLFNFNQQGPDCAHTHTQNQQGSGQIQPTPHPMGCICCPDKNNKLSKTRDNIHWFVFVYNLWHYCLISSSISCAYSLPKSSSLMLPAFNHELSSRCAFQLVSLTTHSHNTWRSLVSPHNSHTCTCLTSATILLR